MSTQFLVLHFRGFLFASVSIKQDGLVKVALFSSRVFRGAIFPEILDLARNQLFAGP